MSGKLYVVATPIGNLEDITLRALRILKEVDVVAAEDTRHSRKLLQHFGIRARMVSYYDQVEERKAGPLVEDMLGGRKVALISDAGTPCIADPGFRLVRAAAAAGVAIEVVPGPSAVVAALSICGLPTDRFAFEGFVPARAGARQRFFAELVTERRTLVVYETARRLPDTLAAMRAGFADRSIVVCRELTKLHEEVLRGTVTTVEESVRASTQTLRGELVLVIGGATAATSTMQPDEIAAALAELRNQGMGLKEAARSLAEEHGLSRNDVYRIGLESADGD